MLDVGELEDRAGDVGTNVAELLAKRGLDVVGDDRVFTLELRIGLQVVAQLSVANGSGSRGSEPARPWVSARSPSRCIRHSGVRPTNQRPPTWAPKTAPARCSSINDPNTGAMATGRSKSTAIFRARTTLSKLPSSMAANARRTSCCQSKADGVSCNEITCGRCGAPKAEFPSIVRTALRACRTAPPTAGRRADARVQRQFGCEPGASVSSAAGNHIKASGSVPARFESPSKRKPPTSAGPRPVPPTRAPSRHRRHACESCSNLPCPWPADPARSRQPTDAAPSMTTPTRRCAHSGRPGAEPGRPP